MPGDILLKDMIVFLPGIMGSTLSKDGKEVWAPTCGVMYDAIKSFGRSIDNLILPDGIGDNDPKDGVIATGLVPDVHVLPGIWTAQIGYSGLVEWLHQKFHLAQPGAVGRDIPNFLPIPYDWRLSNRLNGRRLKGIVEPALDVWRAQGGVHADAKVIFICHSMGGLVARWFIEMEGGAEITRKLITLGTPHRGALKALDGLVNGVTKKLGPLGIDLTRFARSLPSMYQLLPEYACVQTATERFKTTETYIPELETGKVSDGMAFHDDLDAAMPEKISFDIHPVVGVRQPTFATARIKDNNLQAIETIQGEDEAGDATVPRFAAIPKYILPTDPSIKYVAEHHGSLQHNGSVLTQLEGILTAKPAIYRDQPQVEISVKVDPVVLAGEPITVEAAVVNAEQVALTAVAIDEKGHPLFFTSMTTTGMGQHAKLGPLAPGLYRIVVSGAGAMRTVVSSVSCVVLVWE